MPQAPATADMEVNAHRSSYPVQKLLEGRLVGVNLQAELSSAAHRAVGVWGLQHGRPDDPFPAGSASVDGAAEMRCLQRQGAIA